MSDISDELLRKAFGGKKDNKKLNVEVKEKSLEELKSIVNSYIDKEVNLSFQLKPDKAFEFGRKMRNEHSLSLSDIERLANEALPEVLKERAGDIKMKLFHQFYDSYLGYFISGLYHDVIGDKTLKIYTKLPSLLTSSRIGFNWGYGYRHPGGKLVIVGYAGGHIGEKMQNGRIVVVGYTGDYVGKEMKGGEIIVKGNVGWRLGDSMSGGKILIFGNAGEFTGINMSGGEIKVKGKVTSAGKRKGGKVFVWKDEWVELS